MVPSLGEQFRRRRERLKLSQGEAGGRARPPVLQKTVSAIETDGGDPALSSLRAYARAIGAELCLRTIGAGRS
jgi:transcriptional regulator with XRE-family HTH domain